MRYNIIINEQFLMNIISETKMLFSNKIMTDPWITTLLNRYDIKNNDIYLCRIVSFKVGKYKILNFNKGHDQG